MSLQCDVTSLVTTLSQAHQLLVKDPNQDTVEHFCRCLRAIVNALEQEVLWQGHAEEAARVSVLKEVTSALAFIETHSVECKAYLINNIRRRQARLESLDHDSVVARLEAIG